MAPDPILRVEHLRSDPPFVTALYAAALLSVTLMVLGYGLFYCWPWGFVWAGAGLAESMLMVVATINVHHFVVDRYIWRSRSAGNARTPAEAMSAA